MTALTNHLAGRFAEDQVAARYAGSGHAILSRRWRGKGGELDLVVEKDGEVVFIEVKKSQSFARAAERLSRRQLGRIMTSAEDYLGHMPLGRLSPARIDVALVDGTGCIDVIENVMAA